MDNTFTIYAGNSQAVNDPLALMLAKPRNGGSEFLRRNALESGSASTDLRLDIDMIHRMSEERRAAVSFTWLNPFLFPDASIKEFTADIYPIKSSRNESAILLLQSWRAGDEKEQQATWDYLKRALDEDRLSERKLFP